MKMSDAAECLADVHMIQRDLLKRSANGPKASVLSEYIAEQHWLQGDSEEWA